MVNLFEAGAANASLMTEIVDTIRSAASSAGVTISDDPLQFLQTASENSAFKSSLQNQLSQFAAARGLAFEPEVSTPTSSAKAQLNDLKNKTTLIPIGTPIALLFIAAALIFLPSIFAKVSGTVFGS